MKNSLTYNMKLKSFLKRNKHTLVDFYLTNLLKQSLLSKHCIIYSEPTQREGAETYNCQGFLFVECQGLFLLKCFHSAVEESTGFHLELLRQLKMNKNIVLSKDQDSKSQSTEKEAFLLLVENNQSFVKRNLRHIKQYITKQDTHHPSGISFHSASLPARFFLENNTKNYQSG